MKILVVAATKEEVSLFNEVNPGKHSLDFLVTGAGMVAVTYELTKHLSKNTYDLAINCGIAGSFDRMIPTGEAVLITEDTLSELGAENDNEFLRLPDLGLSGNDTFKSTFSINDSTELSIKKVKGITVNTVHGNELSIQTVIKRYHPQVESMEGAAFFFVCERENIRSLQLRTISNYVEKRNRENWNIPLALSNLKASLEKLISIL